MPIGFDKEEKVVNVGDTIVLRARLFDQNDSPVIDDLVSATFTVQHPDATKDTIDAEIDQAGVATAIYALTTLVGHHNVACVFELFDGQKRSTYDDFKVIDPFLPANQTAGEWIRDAVFHKLEDCFDSEDEGPWLTDMSQNYFNKEKFSDFIDEALFDINQYNPPTTETIDNFFAHDSVANTWTPNTNFPLLAQGTFVIVIRHLMRSYTEQPLPQNAPVAYEDRRDYLQRWEQVYQLEAQIYDRWVKLWKRQFLQLGHAKGLVSSKAGRLIPAPMRTRMVGRGYFALTLLPLLLEQLSRHL